jgi:hypothetical protein
MTSYPRDRFVQEFARRTHQNLRDIKAGRPIGFEDTALVSSLLAVFVLPHERADDAGFMEELLANYDQRSLDDVVRVLRIESSTAAAPELEGVPRSIGDVPRFMRHAIAHMNIRPQSADGQSLTHLLVWNNNPRSKKTTFVASVHVARLRSLALHILERLSASELGDRYDGIDPIAKFDVDHPQSEAVTAQKLA